MLLFSFKLTVYIKEVTFKLNKNFFNFTTTLSTQTLK